VGLNFFVRRKILKNTNAMDLIPIRRCQYESEEDGKITVLIPKFRNEKVAHFMLGRKARFIKIHLDDSGSAVWLEMDGIKDLRAISDSLKTRFGEDFAQPEQRINKFISRLYEERYITFRQLEDARKKQ
jgi:hypothetical protein